MGIKRIGIIISPGFIPAISLIPGGGYGDTPALILQRHAFINTQWPAAADAGGNRLPVGKGSGVAHLLAGIGCGAVNNIVVGFRILQHRLTICQSYDTAGRIHFADGRLSVDTTGGKQNYDSANREENFHGGTRGNLSLLYPGTCKRGQSSE